MTSAFIKLDTATARRIAAAADTDPRTVQRVANGEKVRGMAGQRAARALVKAGLIRDDSPAATKHLGELTPAHHGVSEPDPHGVASKK